VSTPALRTFSYGGGVQSTAALVLAARREIDFDTFLFANTGDDSEHPATLRYVREVAMPYAAGRGIALHELSRVKRDGTVETLMGRISNPDRKSVGIPVRMQSGAPAIRSCTIDFKIRVIHRWVKATVGKTGTWTTGLGISLDEISRARSGSDEERETLEYPLIDLRLSRQDCVNIIEREGIPVPGKSSCYFCPYHSRAFWARQQREEPELFARSAALERFLSERSQRLGHGPLYLTDALVPLDMAIVDVGQQELDFEQFACAGGASCMT
jgi:hypothetical protein